MIGALGWLGDPVNPLYGASAGEAVRLCLTVTPTPTRTLTLATTPNRVLEVETSPTRVVVISIEVCD